MRKSKTTNSDYEVIRDNIVVGNATMRPGGNYTVNICCKKKDIINIVQELYSKIEAGKN
ncbi:MAG: hypothetical protein PHP92_03575 [Candidatus Nanoarchaeia archaeon]|nr:hypothetical protein [Candidatus Nanoarchaeia archaeon]